MITTKRDGLALSDEAITWVLDGYLRGEVAEEQMSALLMAIYFNGLDARELTSWTDAMIAPESDSICAASRARRSTSTRPAASATRFR